MIRQTASSVLAPRVFHPRQVLWRLPPLVATVSSRSTLWPDRSIIIPITGYGPAGYCLAVWNGSGSLTAEATTANEKEAVLFCILQVLAQLSNGYPFLRMAMGMYLTAFYSAFKLPVKEYSSLHYIARGKGRNITHPKNIFSIFFSGGKFSY